MDDLANAPSIARFDGYWRTGIADLDAALENPLIKLYHYLGVRGKGRAR